VSHFLPPFPWKSSCESFANCAPPSTRGRTLFEARGVPAQIASLEAEAAAPNVWDDQRRANALFAELRTLKKQWEPVEALKSDVDALVELAESASTADLPSLEEDTLKLEQKWASVEGALYLGGEFDACDCYVSVSGGAGGTEAQDWAAMLMRMYLRYAERKGWTTEMLEKTDGQEAGIKSATILVKGDLAYGNLKCEKGTHRLVRLSPFNAKSLRQTSFALVEVLPELPESGEVEIPASELKVDTYRSGGAGGQHVNKTESAVRITHIPTGIVVSCQTERSQIQNRARAMNMLHAKILEKKRQEEQAKKKELKGATESADFGQQIRSYVLHPYQMVKDLRTDHETSNTQGVLDGDIQDFVDAELKRQARENPNG
jgi:peptide chain release factor 2